MLPQLCKHLAESELKALGGCPTGSVPMVHTGMYAVQIAWWLAFFPPESFLILTSSELRDPALAVQVCTATEYYLGQLVVGCVLMWHQLHTICSLVIDPETGSGTRSMQIQVLSHLPVSLRSQELDVSLSCCKSCSHDHAGVE